MVAELAFLLLILIVLGGLVASVYFKARRQPGRNPGDTFLAAHQAQYLRYLAYVPKHANAESGAEVAARHSARGTRVPRVSGDPNDPFAELTADEPDAAGQRVAALNPLGILAGPGSGAGNVQAETAAISADAVVNDTASVLAARRSATRAEPEEESLLLEVTVVNVGGNAATAAASGGSRGSSGSGTLLVGQGPGTSGSSDGKRAADRPQRPASILLIAVPGDGSAPEPAAAVQAVGGSPGTGAGAQARGATMRRVEFQHRGADRWRRWPDANFRNIVGDRGTDALNQAFDLLQDSDAESITVDLFRKGIPMLFGDPEAFNDPTAPAAVFIYPDSRPPDPPIPPPILTFNPKFLNEDPRVLAAVLAHEGTHFQQYLDGTLHEKTVDQTTLETEAWTNGAVAWQQMRRSALGLNTPLVRDMEVGYQVVRQGEGLLRDFVASLYTHDH